jgi:bifunctional DNase/RNase
MREVEVVGVRVEMPTNQPLVLLRELDGGRYLPIWIGAVEASAIAYAQQGTVTARPLTHELMQHIVEALGDELNEVQIVDVRDGIFYALLIFASGATVEARPSDSIALALRSGSRILCAEDVLDEAGILATTDEDEEIEKFREFLDEISPEDFEKPPPDV